MKPCYIGFDTSNYTTSAAACTEDGRVIANCKAPLPVAEGQRGLRQSDAVFAHVKNLPDVCRALSAAIEGYFFHFLTPKTLYNFFSNPFSRNQKLL